MEDEGIAAVSINAGASQAARANAFHAFQADPEVKVFVLLVKAAAVGLTLTCASRVVLMEPGLCLADEAQAIGRVHRLGQERPCCVIKMAVKGTVEEKILERRKGAQPPEAVGDGVQLPAGETSDSAVAAQEYTEMMSVDVICSLLE